MLFASATKVSAQEKTYNELLEKIIRNSHMHQILRASSNMYIPGMVASNEKWLKDPSLSDELIAKYSESRLFNNYLNVILMPSISVQSGQKKESALTMHMYVTETELRELAETLKTPEANLFYVHDSIAARKVEQAIYADCIKREFKELRKVEINSDIPYDYISLFDKYLLQKYKDIFDNNALQVRYDKFDDESIKVWNFASYLKNNFRALCLNSYYGIVTKEDLQWSINHQENEILNKIEKAVFNILNKPNKPHDFRNNSIAYKLNNIGINTGYDVWLRIERKDIATYTTELEAVKAREERLLNEINQLESKLSQITVPADFKFIRKSNYLNLGVLTKDKKTYTCKFEFETVDASAQDKLRKHILSVLSKIYWGVDYNIPYFYKWLERYKKNFDSFKETYQFNESISNNIIISSYIYVMNANYVIFTVNVNDDYHKIYHKQSFMLNLNTDQLCKMKDIFTSEAIDSLNLKSVVDNGRILFNSNSLLLAKPNEDYTISLNIIQSNKCLSPDIIKLYVHKRCYDAMAGTVKALDEKNKELQTVVAERKKIEESDEKRTEDVNKLKDLSANDGRIYEVVEQMPEFPGGPQAMFEFVSKNIMYPKESEKLGIQGRVIVRFVVDCDGSITNVSIVKSVDPSLDKEAVRVVKSMPRWIPGKNNGSAVRVKYTVPVTFRLQ